MKVMKILIVSHNVLSQNSNMGKTLHSYFENFLSDELAQFYIQPEIPTMKTCKNYFRITDKDALKSIFTRKCGNVLKEADIECDRAYSREDVGAAERIYEKGRSRTPFIYLARNAIWRLGNWNNRAFRAWVDEFDPDMVFFASGDYAFMYRIALKVAKRKKIPLVVSCVDDFYFYNKNEKRFLGKFSHKLFMQQVKKTMAYASLILPICDRMTQDYSVFFQKTCHTLHTATMIFMPLEFPRKKQVSYLGNLDFSRHLQLVSMGRALKSLDLDNAPHCIDVYSAEKNPEILKYLVPENGIRFHGRVSAEEVKKIMGESLAVIHTESFDESITKTVRYSVSTKIADSLASGTPLIAYGPADVASIEYLKTHNAALVVSSEDALAERLTSFFEDATLRETIRENALCLARKNHIKTDGGESLKDILESLRLEGK